MSITHRRLHEILDHKTGMLLGQGYHEEALRVGRKSLELAERAYGPGHLEVIRCLQKLGDIYFDLDELDEANTEFERALRIAAQVLPDDEVTLTRLYLRMAALSERRGQTQHASYYYDRVVNTLEQSNGGSDPYFSASVLASIARYFNNRGDYQRALDNFQRALAIFQELDMSSLRNRDTKAEILYELGNLYHHADAPAYAESTHLEALELRQSIFGSNHVETGRSEASLGTVYHDIGEYVDAALHLRRALDILENHLPELIDEYEPVASRLIEALEITGKKKEMRFIRKRLRWARSLADKRRKEEESLLRQEAERMLKI